MPIRRREILDRIELKKRRTVIYNQFNVTFFRLGNEEILSYECLHAAKSVPVLPIFDITTELQHTDSLLMFRSIHTYIGNCFLVEWIK